MSFQKLGLFWRGSAIVILGVFMASCSFPVLTYVGDSSSRDQDVAIVENRGGCPFCILAIWTEDGKTQIYDKRADGAVQEFHVSPNTYKIYYWHWDASRRLDKVELKAGHRYRVRVKARRGYLWIEDRESGEVVAGVK